MSDQARVMKEWRSLGLDWNLVNGFIRRVSWKLAQKYRCRDCFEDLVSVGWVAFMEAMRRYESSRGVRVLAFACKYVWGGINRWCIKQLLWRSMLSDNGLDSMKARSISAGSTAEQELLSRERREIMRKVLLRARLDFEDCYAYIDPQYRSAAAQLHRTTMYRRSKKSYDALKDLVIGAYNLDTVDASQRDADELGIAA